MYQLKQIALNNFNEVSSLLMQKYNLPAPDNADEITTAVEVAADNYGNEFINDLYNVQLQKNTILQNEVAYKNQLDSSSKEQLRDELIRLNLKLTQAQDIPSREYILDKVAYVQKLIIQKNEENKPNLSSIHKNNQMLLLALTVIALMFVGSKIFKQ